MIRLVGIILIVLVWHRILGIILIEVRLALIIWIRCGRLGWVRVVSVVVMALLCLVRLGGVCSTNYEQTEL
jgi:hypothetical protein